MAFRFPLAAVLRLRKGLEHQEELLLQSANQEVARVRQQIEELDHGLAAAWAREARQLQSGLSAAELYFEFLCRSVLLERRRHLAQELTKREQLRDRHLLAYQQARRSREILDSLRDRQLHLYRQRETRQEQRSLDDLFLLRREFLRRG